VTLVQEFPMTVTGKVQKFKLREQAIEALGLGAPDGDPSPAFARPGSAD